MDLNQAFELLNRRIGQIVQKGEREVARQFAHLLADIRKQMADVYERYEVGGVLTLADMTKYDRLNKLFREIDKLLVNHYKEINQLMPKIMGDIYLEGFYLTAWAVEHAAQTQLAYAVASTATIQAAILNPVDKLKTSVWIASKLAETRKTFQREITQGFYKGEPYGGMVKRIKPLVENDAWKVMRVVRTEGHRVQESGKYEAVDHANKQGVIMAKMWNSMEDERVRRPKGKQLANHAKLNEKTLPMDGLFNDGLGEGPKPGEMGAAGSDINCRCFLTYEIVRIEKPDKHYKDMPFDDWKKRLKAA